MGTFASYTNSETPDKEASYQHDFFDPDDIPVDLQSELRRAASIEADIPVEEMEWRHIERTEVYKQFKTAWDDAFNEIWQHYVWQEYASSIELASDHYVFDLTTDVVNGDEKARREAKVTMTMPRADLMKKWPDLLHDIGEGSSRPVERFLTESMRNFSFDTYDLSERWSSYLDDYGAFEAGVEMVTKKFAEIFPDFNGLDIDAPGQTFLPFEER